MMLNIDTTACLLFNLNASHGIFSSDFEVLALQFQEDIMLSRMYSGQSSF